ncbi:MAG: glycosyltransferase family 1 protein [Candidatus Korobacteraceae bacterium]
MRIYYDHQLCSLQNAGGASRYHYELMNYLSGVPDVETETFLGMNTTVYPYKQKSSRKARVMSFAGPLRKGVVRYAANELMGNFIAPFRGKFDVYHPTHHRIMPWVRSRRIVITHHDCIYERFPVFRFTAGVLRAKRALFERADAIICISEASRQDLFAFYNIDPAKTRVIHHGLSRLPDCPQAARTVAQKTRREFLLYVGSRAPYKNFGGLLRAFRDTGLHESLDLLVLGGGPLTTEERAVAKRLEISQRLITIPLSSDALLGAAYAAAKVFVYPSLWEGFGFSPLEAMAAGCPVVACRVSSVPEVCRDAPFYFEPETPGSLDRALFLAVNDDESRRGAILRGKEIAAGYSWEKCGKATLALYRECL